MERKITKTIIKNYIVEGHTFVICQDDEGNFWGFDKKELEETRLFNGITGHRSNEINETLRKCYTSARFDNEIDKEKFKNNDLNEFTKFTKIIEESFRVVGA